MDKCIHRDCFNCHMIKQKEEIDNPRPWRHGFYLLWESRWAWFMSTGFAMAGGGVWGILEDLGVYEEALPLLTPLVFLCIGVPMIYGIHVNVGFEMKKRRANDSI